MTPDAITEIAMIIACTMVAIAVIIALVMLYWGKQIIKISDIQLDEMEQWKQAHGFPPYDKGGSHKWPGK